MFRTRENSDEDSKIEEVEMWMYLLFLYFWLIPYGSLFYFVAMSTNFYLLSQEQERMFIAKLKTCCHGDIKLKSFSEIILYKT